MLLTIITFIATYVLPLYESCVLLEYSIFLILNVAIYIMMYIMCVYVYHVCVLYDVFYIMLVNIT